MILIFLIAALHPAVFYEERTQTVVARTGELQVFLGDLKTPLLGDVEREGLAIRFRPRFPFLPDRDYRAVLRVPGSAPVAYSFHTKAVFVEASRVVAVYPSADVVPAKSAEVLRSLFASDATARDGGTDAAGG